MKVRLLARRFSPVLLTLIGTVSAQGTEIEIGGSSTVYPISVAMAEEFGVLRPDAASEVIVQVNGTGGGFANFCAGEYALTSASRPIEPDEVEVCDANGVAFVELPVALDALTVVVNPDVTFTECLSVDQLQRLFAPASDVQTWRDLDPAFPDEPISLFVPGRESGTYDYFTETVVGGPASRDDVIASEDDDTLVLGVIDTPFSLGYFGYAYYVENQDEINALSIDSGEGCVAPSTETILDASYTPLSRPLFIYVSVAALEDPDVEAFAALFLASESCVLIEDTGYALLSDRAYDLAQNRLSGRTAGSTFQDFQPGMQLLDALE